MRDEYIWLQIPQRIFPIYTCHRVWILHLKSLFIVLFCCSLHSSRLYFLLFLLQWRRIAFPINSALKSPSINICHTIRTLHLECIHDVIMLYTEVVPITIIGSAYIPAFLQVVSGRKKEDKIIKNVQSFLLMECKHGHSHTLKLDAGEVIITDQNDPGWLLFEENTPDFKKIRHGECSYSIGNIPTLSFGGVIISILLPIAHLRISSLNNNLRLGFISNQNLVYGKKHKSS